MIFNQNIIHSFIHPSIGCTPAGWALSSPTPPAQLLLPSPKLLSPGKKKWLLIASVAPSVWKHISHHPVGPCSGLFLKGSMCHQHFRASRQIATGEHKRGAGGQRAREGSSLGRLFCAFLKRAHLVPGGGLFTGLTPASANSPF